MSANLVLNPNHCVRRRVVFCRVGELAVGELNLGVILDFVKEDDFAVGQEASVHRRNTGLTDDLDRSSVGVCWSRRRARGGRHGSASARSTLASIAAVRGGVATVAVSRAASPLRPVAAHSVAVVCTTSSVLCCRPRRGCS